MTTFDFAAAAPVAPAPATAAPSTARAQRLARITGVLMLITFVASIPAVAISYVPVLGDPAYIIGGAPDLGLPTGALLELLVVFANIGTALALFPILKRESEALSLSYVAGRLVESGLIALGLVALLAVGTLRGTTGADPATLTLVGKALIAVHDWTFRLGPGVVVGIGNGLILGWLMFRTRLVPRALSILGLIGGPLILASGIAVLFGTIPPAGTWQILATIPEFFWELILGFWLMLRGFDRTALAALDARA